MVSVEVAKQREASQGWEWQPDEGPARRDTVAKISPPLPKPAGGHSIVSGSAVVCITLLVAGWFVWPAGAARQWDAARLPASAPQLMAWTGARGSQTSPQAVLIELAQREGTDGAVVPPVKRQAPQAPASQPAPSAQPQTAPEAPVVAEQPAPTAPPDSSGSWFSWDGVSSRISDWLSRANREYQGTIVKELSKPGADDAEAGRLAAEKAAQEQAAREQAERAAAEQARAAAAEQEARKRAEAEEQRKAQEAARAEEARKQAEAAAQQKAAQQPPEPAAPDNKAAEQAEAEKLREAARLAEERKAQRLQEEKARREQAEAERKAREARAEQERKAKALAEAEAKLKAAQAARERREAEAPAAREQPDPVLRHRKWSVTIIPEPIGRPDARWREEGGAVLAGARRLDDRMSLGAGSVRAGTAVKRWAMRAASCRYAGEKRKRRYVVARGDSLWRISKKYYHRGSKYPRIYKANRDRIADPDLIYPCQRFRIPKR